MLTMFTSDSAVAGLEEAKNRAGEMSSA